MNITNSIYNGGTVPKFSSGDALPDPTITPLVDNEVFLNTTDSNIYVSVGGAWVQFAPTVVTPVFPLAYPVGFVTAPVTYNIDPSADYTLVVDLHAGNANVNLPNHASSVAVGQMFVIKIPVIAALNAITVKVLGGTGTIDGNTTVTLSGATQVAITVQYISSDTYIVLSRA